MPPLAALINVKQKETHSTAKTGTQTAATVISHTYNLCSSMSAPGLTWHMAPTIAAVELLSAPPDSGSRNPEAPDRLR